MNFYHSPIILFTGFLLLVGCTPQSDGPLAFHPDVTTLVQKRSDGSGYQATLSIASHPSQELQYAVFRALYPWDTRLSPTEDRVEVTQDGEVELVWDRDIYEGLSYQLRAGYGLIRNSSVFGEDAGVRTETEILHEEPLTPTATEGTDWTLHTYADAEFPIHALVEQGFFLYGVSDDLGISRYDKVSGEKVALTVKGKRSGALVKAAADGNRIYATLHSDSKLYAFEFSTSTWSSISTVPGLPRPAFLYIGNPNQGGLLSNHTLFTKGGLLYYLRHHSTYPMTITPFNPASGEWGEEVTVEGAPTNAIGATLSPDGTVYALTRLGELFSFELASENPVAVFEEQVLSRVDEAVVNPVVVGNQVITVGASRFRLRGRWGAVEQLGSYDLQSKQSTLLHGLPVTAENQVRSMLPIASGGELFCGFSIQRERETQEPKFIIFKYTPQ